MIAVVVIHSCTCHKNTIKTSINNKLTNVYCNSIRKNHAIERDVFFSQAAGHLLTVEKIVLCHY